MWKFLKKTEPMGEINSKQRVVMLCKWEMFCSRPICRKEEGGETGRKMNAFVRGTTNLKLETIKHHEIVTERNLRILNIKHRIEYRYPFKKIQPTLICLV